MGCPTQLISQAVCSGTQFPILVVLTVTCKRSGHGALEGSGKLLLSLPLPRWARWHCRYAEREAFAHPLGTHVSFSGADAWEWNCGHVGVCGSVHSLINTQDCPPFRW